MVWQRFFMHDYIILAIVILPFLCLGNVVPFSDQRHRLFKDMFRGYDKRIKPVRNISQPVKLKIRMTYYMIQEVNERMQFLKSNIWLNIIWKDEFLQWNKETYGGIDEVFIPFDDIWKPDLVLYNSAGDIPTMTSTVPAIELQLYSNGLIWWNFPLMIKSFCKIDVSLYPFDTQKCNLTFSSWSRGGHVVYYDIFADSAILENYVPSGEWKLVGVPCMQDIVYYPCCSAPWTMVTFTVILQRKSLFYILYLIVPCCSLVLVGALVFVLPSECGEKVSLGTTVLLSMAVYLLVIMENVPETSDTIPLISQFMGCTLMLLVLSTTMAVLVLNMHHKKEIGTKPPDWLLDLVCKKIARILCMTQVTRMMKTFENKTENNQQSISIISNVQNGIAPTNAENKEVQEKTSSNNNLTEWEMISLVMDRCFLVIYLVLSVAVLVGVYSNLMTSG